SVAEVTRVLEQAHARGADGKPAEDQATETYREAAISMSQHWYRRALPRLQEVRKRAPQAPWVADQVDEANLQIKAGHDESPSNRPVAPVAVAAVLFAIVAV